MNDTNRFQAPTADLSVAPTAEELTWKQIYLRFDGRIPRKVFWIWGVLIPFGAAIVLGIVSAISETLGMVLAVPLYIFMIWAGLAVSIKRWHDRDKSGWWVLIGLIPVIGGLWALIENGFLRGTAGPNRFGEDRTGD